MWWNLFARLWALPYVTELDWEKKKAEATRWRNGSHPRPRKLRAIDDEPARVKDADAWISRGQEETTALLLLRTRRNNGAAAAAEDKKKQRRCCCWGQEETTAYGPKQRPVRLLQRSWVWVPGRCEPALNSGTILDLQAECIRAPASLVLCQFHRVSTVSLTTPCMSGAIGQFNTISPSLCWIVLLGYLPMDIS
jgi:hypothetical protein